MFSCRSVAVACERNINHPGWNIKRKPLANSIKTNIAWRILKKKRESNMDDVKKQDRDVLVIMYTCAQDSVIFSF